MIAAADFDLLLHYIIRTLMRDCGMSADEAYDTAITVVVDVIEELTDDPMAVALYRTLFSERRESLLPPYRQPQPDLTDLKPVLQAEEAAARRQRRRCRRRRLDG